MAATTAASRGLKAVLLERHKDLLDPPRLDASMFYFNFLTPEVYVEPVNVVFGTGTRMEEGKRNQVRITFDFVVPGFKIEYVGPAVLNYHYINLSPGGHRVWAIKDELWSFYFSREVFLNGLLNGAVKNGVNIVTGARVDSVENQQNGVLLTFSADGKREQVEADYAIVADGLNSLVVGSLGLNRDRPVLGTGKFVAWVFDGLKIDHDIPAESAWLSFNYPSVSPMGLTLSPYYEKGNVRLKQLMGISNEAIEKFIRHTRYASWFDGARVLRKMAIAVESRRPLKEVVYGRCVLAG
ncbi:MAG: FAD-dependent monooxygenase, partial [Dehalococcoidia bacterium]|nr:FAD-dependent monooxygenase [Dehalococcoidia bacterium]